MSPLLLQLAFLLFAHGSSRSNKKDGKSAHLATTLPVINLSVLGMSGVGKSSICTALKGEPFAADQEATLGSAFLVTSITSQQSKRTYQLNIWDTAGQERFQALTPIYLRQAQIILLAFDVNDSVSFNYLRGLHDSAQLERFLKDPKICKLIVGNKIDLAGKRQVQKIAGLNMCSSFEYEAYLEMSARTKHGLEDLKDHIAKLCDTVYAIEGMLDSGSSTIKVSAPNTDPTPCCQN